MSSTHRFGFGLPIPVLGLCALALSCAKGDEDSGNVDGDWSLRSVSYDGEVYQFPQTYTSDSDYMCTYTSGRTMHIDGDEVEIVFYYTARDCNDPELDQSYQYTYAGEIESVSGGHEISFEGELLLVCTLEGADLRCEEPADDVPCAETFGDTDGEGGTDGTDTDGEDAGGVDTDGCEQDEEGPPIISRWVRV